MKSACACTAAPSTSHESARSAHFLAPPTPRNATRDAKSARPHGDRQRASPLRPTRRRPPGDAHPALSAAQALAATHGGTGNGRLGNPTVATLALMSVENGPPRLVWVLT